jgi:hypothetical protein
MLNPVAARSALFRSWLGLASQPPESGLRTRICAHIIGLVLATNSLSVGAIDGSFKTFGTLAAIGTDTDHLTFVRDASEDKGATSAWGINVDSRLGLQLDVDFNEQLHAMLQWVARDHAGNFFTENVDWAFLRWRPRDDLDIRLGRMGLDIFLLSDYRNIDYAYLWMRPPSEFYGVHSMNHFNGVDIAKKFAVGEGQLTLKGYAGYDSEAGAYNTLYDYLLWGVNLVHESGNWRSRMGYYSAEQLHSSISSASIAELQTPAMKQQWPGIQSIAHYLSTPDKPVHYGSLGVAYDDGIWPVQSELSYIDSEISGFANRINGYLSVGRRFGKVTPFALYGFEQSLTRKLYIPAPAVPSTDLLNLRTAIDSGLNRSVDQMSLSLGARWDIYENVDLKVQWSHYWLGQNSSLTQWLYPATPLPNQVNVWSFGVDFVY